MSLQDTINKIGEEYSPEGGKTLGHSEFGNFWAGNAVAGAVLGAIGVDAPKIETGYNQLVEGSAALGNENSTFLQMPQIELNQEQQEALRNFAEKNGYTVRSLDPPELKIPTEEIGKLVKEGLDQADPADLNAAIDYHGVEPEPEAAAPAEPAAPEEPKAAVPEEAEPVQAAPAEAAQPQAEAPEMPTPQKLDVQEETIAPIEIKQKPVQPQPVEIEQAASISPSPEVTADTGFAEIVPQDHGPYEVDPNVMEAQAMMANLDGLGVEGIDLGSFSDAPDGIDGRAGPMTKASVMAVQEHLGMEVTGTITPKLMEQMQAEIADLEMNQDVTAEAEAAVEQSVTAEVPEGIDQPANAGFSFNEIFDPQDQSLALGSGELFSKACIGEGFTGAEYSICDPEHGALSPVMSVGEPAIEPPEQQPEPDMQQQMQQTVDQTGPDMSMPGMV